MAYTAKLYDLARSPVKKKSWYDSVPSGPSLPDFSDEYELVKNTACSFLNHAYDQIENRVPDEFKKYYSNFENHIRKWLVGIGLGHIPPRLVVKYVSFFLVLSFCVISYARKIKRRRRHKMLYGNNAFPPYARAGMTKTIAAMITNSKSPWFFKQCSDEIQSSVFRLRLPFVKAPMVVAVGDLVTVKEILQDPGTIKSESHFKSIGSVAG
jgi:hypothetical protein